jgi:hypothetical protein
VSRWSNTGDEKPDVKLDYRGFDRFGNLCVMFWFFASVDCG